MADGAWQQTRSLSDQAVRLKDASVARASLWAVCGCGGETVLDPTNWLGQGLGRHPLHALEDRLRCRCGARRARLEIRGLAEAPPAGGGIYLFR